MATPREAGGAQGTMPLVLHVCLALVLFGCYAPVDGHHGGRVPPFLETGDLSDIQRRGVLRVLTPVLSHDKLLPREGFPLDFERDLIEAYALQRGLETFWVYVESRSDLIPFLLEGRGDLIAANLTVTPELEKEVDFTVPVRHTREQVVTRTSDHQVTEPAHLEGRRVSARRSSSCWPALQRLVAQHPGITLHEVPEDMDADELIYRVSRRKVDVTVADSNLIQSTRAHLPDIRVAFDLTGDRAVAWALRPGARSLRRDLDRYLTEAQLSETRRPVALGDLPEIKQSRVLRVLTRNSPGTYFLWRGELMGFEYELARKFAQDNGLRVEIVVPPRNEDLVDWLLSGRGDIVAGVAVPSDATPQRPGLSFCRPYAFTSRVVVARNSEPPLGELDDLLNRTVYAHDGDPQWSVLNELRSSGVNFSLQAVPQHLTSAEIISLVGEGRYDLAVADSRMLDIELTWRDDVRAAFPVGEPIPLRWIVRETNPELKAAVNQFVRKEYRGEFYNITYRKYFKDSKRIRRHTEVQLAGNGALSPYDEIIRRYARKYGFDWRLIVSLMYEESRFDPQARSFAGAVGLLQLLPRTAKEMGFEELDHPETNIHAGLKYLAWLRERFEADLPVQERLWFTLASYNIGPGHVRDARRVAASRGLNPDRWFGNVERAMQLLSSNTYASTTSNGYCRGTESVRYVSEIRSRYNTYVETLDPGPLPAVGVRASL